MHQWRSQGRAKQGQALPIFRGTLPKAAQLPASVYSKYRYLQIIHPFLHERALTVAQKHKKLEEIAQNESL